MRLSIVLPAFNEAEVLATTVARVRDAAVPCADSLEVIVVDDGSTDGTWDVITELARDGNLRGIRLSRNFGHQTALTAGLQASTGDAVITMDSDLQHPPELIPDLLAKAREGYDVVYAVRSIDDAEHRFKVHSARVFYALLNRLTSLDLPAGGADYRYMSRRVVDAVLSMPERTRFLRGMTRWVGFEQGKIDYSRPARGAGRSKYTLRAMFRLATNAVVSFSAIPLRLASVFGFMVAAAGAVYLAYVVVVKLTNHRAVPGWTSVVITALILGGVQLIFLGVIGQYLSRMYDENKARPLFFVAADTADEPAD
jgi:polyisoprenyl-phosphate glycosyltransferase